MHREEQSGRLIFRKWCVKYLSLEKSIRTEGFLIDFYPDVTQELVFYWMEVLDHKVKCLNTIETCKLYNLLLE